MNTNRWRWLLLLALLASCALQAADEDEDENPAEAEELAALLDVISEETEIATRTRMNADYVPGIVSVLDGDTLAAYGVHTVWEALQFVPGVETVLDPAGTPTLTVRGIPFPFNSGSIHIMIDGAAVSRESTGMNSAALLLPIGQVERIEFIRGPGSVVYGDFAFQGLLNIITRSKERALSVGGDAEGSQWANLSYGREQGPWRFALNLAPARSDDAVQREGERADETRLFANMLLAYGDFSARVQHVGRELERTTTGVPVRLFDESSTAIGLRYDHSLGADLALQARLDHLDNELFLASSSFSGVQTTLTLDATYAGFARQNWLFGASWSDGEIERATFSPPLPPGVPPPPPQAIGARDRTVASAYLQDQVSLGDDLTLTLGARYDDSDEIGSRVTPRVAAVWQFATGHLLKAQYAEGFRSPTFFEIYTNPTSAPPLDFEVNRTSEVSYIRQRPDSALRFTLFASRIDDMVFRDFRRQRFGNVAEAESRGFEAEYNRQISEQLRVDAKFSRSDSEHNRNPTLRSVDIGAAADWLGQAGLLWQPRRDTTLAARYYHVGPRASVVPHREYGTLALSLTRRNLFDSGLDLRVSADNLLHDATTMVQPTPVADVAIAYRDRRVFADLSWRW
jgi:iron complex outermembrane receptor protein